MAAAAFAQEQPAAQPRVDLNSLPPSVRLGLRAKAVRCQVAVFPVVVVVPDAASYAAAIATWKTTGRFPVLIDDATPQASEDIGRFIRAFAPQRVVRYKTVGTWPADTPSRRRSIEDAVAQAWGAPDAKGLGARWNELKLAPFGVVVASDADPAWTGALALAAGHAQPVAWIDASGNAGGVNQEIPVESADSLAAAVENACEGTGLGWRELGDAVEAVTLCLDLPGRVLTGPDDRVALTDYVGRRDDGSGRARGPRWAWCGQVFGSESRCAYTAMCGLFLQPKAAWLFDGYEDKPPYNGWDATKAGGPLTDAGIAPTIDDTPRQGAQQWDLRASLPSKAGVIFVNTQGNIDYFDLMPGRERSGNVPILDLPAMVHFVHSWSAAYPADRGTIAGRWLERGVYAYAGSIQEPYLNAFAPTPALAVRLTVMPWGAAVRLDEGPAWRIAVIGDPLITVGGTPPAAGGEFPLTDGTTDADEELAGLLTSKDYARALRLLVLLGRDADAARLARGLLGSPEKPVASGVAAECVLPVFRTPAQDRAAVLVGLFGVMSPEDAGRPGLRDALWLACLPGLWGQRDDAILDTLSDNLRPDQPGRDAAALAPAIRAARGRAAAEALLDRARGMRDNYTDHTAIDEALRALN